MNKVEHESGYIHMHAIAVCDDCLQAFDTCDSDYWLCTFDGEELQADCPYCSATVYVEAYFEQ